MTRIFVQTSEFTKKWKQYGFSDEDLRLLENQILQNPKVGPVMQGTGRLRKMRFAFENSGKSGSVRVCYVDFENFCQVYLITVFAKNEKSNLSKIEKNQVKVAIETIEKNLEKTMGGQK